MVAGFIQKQQLRPVKGAISPAISLASSVLPMPLRPTKPVGVVSKVSVSSENKARPLGNV